VRACVRACLCVCVCVHGMCVFRSLVHFACVLHGSTSSVRRRNRSNYSRSISISTITRRYRSCSLQYIYIYVYIYVCVCVSRNVLSCCQRYSTNIDSVIAFRFKIEHIDRIANTASDDVCNRVTMLNELLQCRDGMHCLSDDSYSSNDVEQLVSSLCTS